MLLRVIRLYPIYIVGITIGATALAMEGTTDFSNLTLGIAAAFFMVIGTSLPVLIGARWSLTYELVANAAYAAIVSRLSNAVLVTICSASALALVVTVILADSIAGGWELRDFGLGLARVSWGFFTGVALFRIYARRMLRQHTIILVMAAVIAAILAFASCRPILASEVVVVLLGFPLLTIAAAFPDVRGSTAQLCAFLGLISYASYVLHEPLAGIFGYIVVRPGYIATPYAGYIYLCVLVLVCWAMDRWYDVPLRRSLVISSRKHLVE